MPATRVLLVEDDPSVSETIQEGLKDIGYDVVRAVDSAEEALKIVESLTPDVILMDIELSGAMDGVEAATEIQRRLGIPVVFSTARDDEATLQRATGTGAFGYVIKPFNVRDLHASIEITLAKHEVDLERTKRLEHEHELLDKTLAGSIEILTEILSTVESESFGRGMRLKSYIKTLAQSLEIEHTWDLEIAGMLSGIGHISLPSTLIQKIRTGIELTSLEREMILRIPEFGRNLLERIPRLEPVAKTVFYQNKNYDGTGFPFELFVAGEDLPIGARMLRILQDLIKLQSSKTSKVNLVKEMRNCQGIYDAQLLEQVFDSLVNAVPRGSIPVALQDLQPGQVLAAPIETEEGVQLVAIDTLITALMCEKLSNFAQFGAIEEPIYILATA